MVTELELANFKAFGNLQRIPLRSITLIFGANSSGKSSILHALLLAHHGVSVGEFDVTTPVLAGDAVDLGGFQRFVFRRDRNLGSQIGLSFEDVVLESEHRSVLSYQQPTVVSIKAVLEINDSWSETALEKYQLWLNGRALVTLQTRGSTVDVSYINTDHPYLEERLARVRKRLFDDAIPMWQLKNLLDELKKSYNFENHAVARGFGSNTFWSQHDEGKSDVSEVCHASLMAAAAYEDPELEEMFENLGGDFLDSPYEFIWLWDEDSIKALPKHIIESNRIKEAFASALKLENAIFREVRLGETLQLVHGAVQEELEKTSYLGPLRALPKRALSAANAGNADWRASGGSAWDELMNNEDVQQSINAWLSADFLNTKYQFNTHITPNFEVLNLFLQQVSSNIGGKFEGIRESIQGGYFDEEDLAFNTEEFVEDAWDDFRSAWSNNATLSASSRELVLTDLRTNTRVSHRDVGIGISQVLPVLVNALGSKNKLLTIEQPELHLHPSLQAELGDVFINSALGDAQNQIIIETHSEHLILRLMRRIRETQDGTLPEGVPRITPEDVAILFVEPTEQGSMVRQIRLDEEGQLIDAWPGGFFEEGFKERFS